MTPARAEPARMKLARCWWKRPFDYFVKCEVHTTDEVHAFSCRDEYRRMYGIKPWRIKQRERMNHQRILGVILEKVAE